MLEPLALRIAAPRLGRPGHDAKLPNILRQKEVKHNETTSRDSDSRVGWTADWYCGIVRMYSNSEAHADTHLNANAEALAHDHAYSDADAASYSNVNPRAYSNAYSVADPDTNTAGHAAAYAAPSTARCSA